LLNYVYAMLVCNLFIIFALKVTRKNEEQKETAIIYEQIKYITCDRRFTFNSIDNRQNEVT